MKDWKRVCRRLFYLPAGGLLFLTAVSGAALAAVFIMGWEKKWIAYMAYVLSAYTLTAVCLAGAKVVPGWCRGIKNRICENKYGNRYMTDAVFRTHVSLHLSLTINLLYAALNAWLGFLNQAVWFITLAAYYGVLAAMRFLLVKYAGLVGIGKERIAELRRSRLCGYILIMMNSVLSGMVVLMIRQNRGYEYYGNLIYVMALYTFYITVHAGVSIVKYQRYNSPVMTTAKVISLAAALVSMLSLETAMLSQFGGETSLQYRQQMIALTGAGIWVVVVVMSGLIILRANREIKINMAVDRGDLNGK